ncbi:hypothetical protein HRbin02_01378 [Candidatus Calditenuaceae archaeon HR02]|nr:hypothetical protein HRbin02_01378 [Candidatus Calditenuaceae archaeon HR02]
MRIISRLIAQAAKTLIRIRKAIMEFLDTLSIRLYIYGVEFRELSDFEWWLIRSLLPPKPRVGSPRADDRRVKKTGYSMSSPPVVGGRICLPGTVLIRRLGGGLGFGRSWASGRRY